MYCVGRFAWQHSMDKLHSYARPIYRRATRGKGNCDGKLFCTPPPGGCGVADITSTPPALLHTYYHPAYLMTTSQVSPLALLERRRSNDVIKETCFLFCLIDMKGLMWSQRQVACSQILHRSQHNLNSDESLVTVLTGPNIQRLHREEWDRHCL
jgi:hypothetical protein